MLFPMTVAVHSWQPDAGSYTESVAVTGRSRSRDWIARLALAAVGIVHIVVVALFPLRQATPPFTFASMSGLAAAGELLGGAVLLGGGLLTTVVRPRSIVGSLAIIASIAWYAPDWIGWSTGPPLVRSLGLVIAPFLAPTVLQLVIAASGGLRDGRLRGVVVGAYALTLVIGAARALVRDPLLDPDCLAPPRDCAANAFLLWPDQRLAAQLDVALPLLTILIGCVIAGVAAWRLWSGTGPARRVQGPLLVSGALLGLSEAAAALIGLLERGESAVDPTLTAIFYARIGAACAVALSLGFAVLRTRQTSVTLARLASDISAAPEAGGLRAALARSLGDPDLDVAYLLPETGAYVDVHGSPFPESRMRPGQIATPIVRNSQPIALVVHDPGVLESHEWESKIGSAARLAVDNERLQAEVQAQLHELGDSRSRIVAAGDNARMLLERDLHDGAQQRLVALSYELRLGRAAALYEGNEHLGVLFDEASTETEAALDELRELAHGIFPAILAEAGLGPALAALADRSPIPLQVRGQVEGRCRPGSENAIYVVIDEVVRSANARGASHVSVEIEHVDGRLAVQINDDGASPQEAFTHLEDRAGAAGGRLIDESDGDGLALRVQLPCA